MNVSTSECSSGCESGWTMYLDHFSNSNDYYNRGDFVKSTYNEYGRKEEEDDDDDDEDLSMVSDASSGPPHNHEYQKQSSETQYFYGGNASSFSQGKMKKKLNNKTKDQMVYCKEQNMCLDDTASSPFYHYSKDNVAPPDNHYSMENVQCEVESKTKKHLSFFKSSSKGKSGE
ncbi:hypothetical protein ACJIZ3_025088 [Penstemon smallii]|uniref:Uncharacterized protein n=1 Tax=Penstemon smallii TaxID=265156 RepID=A0ABD3TTU3_9LAMI